MNSILVVDDSKAMRMIIRRALAATGFGHFSVREASDGEEAFRLIGEDRPDLVLSDWNMPGWSGIDLVSALHRAGTWLPVIFVTSEATPQMHALARSHGVAAIVSKPFTPEELAGAVRSATGSRRV